MFDSQKHKITRLMIENTLDKHTRKTACHEWFTLFYNVYIVMLPSNFVHRTPNFPMPTQIPSGQSVNQ